MSSNTIRFIDSFFECDLDLTLSLDAEGTKTEIVSGSIEKIALDLHSYGFNGSLQLSSFGNEELDGVFNSTKVTKIVLSFKPTDPLLGAAPIFELKGIVIGKLVRRVDAIGENKPQSIRLYEIAFFDAAQAIWSEHFPINIYVDESMKNILDEHKNSDISIKYNFSPLEVKHPITAFSLGYQDALPQAQQVSFYSFLLWYLQKEGGMLVYDYKANSYSILGQKEAAGDPYKIHEWWAAPPLAVFPKPKRHNKKIIQHSSDTQDGATKTNEDAFKLIRRDDIHTDNYRAFPEQAHEIVHSALNSTYPLFELEPTIFVDDFHIHRVLPGCLISFDGGADETWCNDPMYKGKVFRARSLVFQADRLTLAEIVEKTVQPYRLYVKNILELKDEKYIETVFFNCPQFPFSIQGKIFSDIGDTPQTTYKISESEQAPQGQYLVTVPLTGGDKKLVVPFTPDMMCGQFYFPFCKGERVLLSLYFHTAKIERIIDWQPFTRLPSGVQGNQIMFSSNSQDKYAFLKHEFEDGKNSVVTLEQATSATQTQTVRIQEKEILITVVEKGQRTVVVQLSGDQGLSFSLEDETTGVTQLTVFNGETMRHICRGSAGTSSIEQAPDSVIVNAKEFTVNSDQIVLNAKESITQVGLLNVDIESPLTNIISPTIKMG